MVVTLSLGAITLLLTSFVRSPSLFLVACFIVGLTSVTTHMAVPLAAHLADPQKRGRQVATIVSGLLTGILFGRPIASLNRERQRLADGFHGRGSCHGEHRLRALVASYPTTTHKRETIILVCWSPYSLW